MPMFRSLKIELGLQPIHQRKPLRMVAHLFAIVLAYQLMQGVRTDLQGRWERASWTTLRGRLVSKAGGEVLAAPCH